MTAVTKRTRFEHAEPILRVSDMAASLRYYTEALGFENAESGSDDFTFVSRDGAGIYLCQGSQGQPGTWAWVASRMRLLCTRSMSSRARAYGIPRAIIPGRSKSMSRIRTGTFCASHRNRSLIGHSTPGPTRSPLIELSRD